MDVIIEEKQKLSNPQVTIEILKKYNFDFKKKFGQNFLIDSHVLYKIMDAAELSKDDFVLEIGPGIGTMTQYLAERAGRVLAVEIDKKAIPILHNTLGMYDNVTIWNEDILKVDLNRVSIEYNDGKPLKVVANLPYYGALSLAVQYYAKPYLAANVPPNCFMPRPNVGSAVIRLSRYDKPPVIVKNEALMFSLIRASFNQRRKTLQNGICNYEKLSYTKEQVAHALESIGLPVSVRGEKLSLNEFAALSDALGETGQL